MLRVFLVRACAFQHQGNIGVPGFFCQLQRRFSAFVGGVNVGACGNQAPDDVFAAVKAAID